MAGMVASDFATRHLHGALVRDMVDRADPALIERSHLIVQLPPCPVPGTIGTEQITQPKVGATPSLSLVFARSE